MIWNFGSAKIRDCVGLLGHQERLQRGRWGLVGQWGRESYEAGIEKKCSMEYNNLLSVPVAIVPIYLEGRLIAISTRSRSTTAIRRGSKNPVV